MKTLQDLYNEIMGNDELKKAFIEAMKTDSIKAFLEAQGCDASLEEVDEFLKGKTAENGSLQLSEEELSEVAGGTEDNGLAMFDRSQTFVWQCC